MIHAALHWPDTEDEALWPLAVSHAVYLYNNTPNAESGITPNEIFSRTHTDGRALRQSHPWGCPVYVLEAKLQDGKNLLNYTVKLVIIDLHFSQILSIGLLL